MQIKRISIKIIGTIAIFQFFDIYTTPSAPNNAGKILSNAGSSTLFWRMGVSGTISATPSAMISIVTMLETAVEMVEIISPSSLLALTPASSMHEIAQGTLRLERLPVTNPRYELPAPSMGI